MVNEKRMIDANALHRRLHERANDFALLDECTAQVIRDDMEIMQEQPTVDAVEVVRHGFWCWITEDIYRCDNCGEMSHVKEVMGNPDWNYCPNCGAKMDGGPDG